METINEITAFAIREMDIPAILNELSQKSNAGSAFYQREHIEDVDTNFKTLYKDLLGDGDFLQAIRIIAQPDTYVTVRTAGIHGLFESRLHYKKDEGPQVVLTEIAEEDRILITVFPDYETYLDSWTDNLSETNDAPAANYIPPLVSLGEFIFILHAVDSFRRISYQNMLNHTYEDKAYVSIPQFTQTMTTAIKSLDLRWLLPSFLAITPGIEQYTPDLNVDNLQILLTHHFFEQGQLDSGEDVLVFSEAGQIMGLEFFHSWLTSWGFEINIKEAGDFTALNRFFIAPTVLTNHFVHLEANPTGKAAVNHQAYTTEELLYKLSELFEKPFYKESAVATPSSAAATKFCGNCGTKLPSSAVFCSNCGAKTN